MKKRIITFEHEGDDDDLRWALKIMTEQVCEDGCWTGFDENEEARYHYWVAVTRQE